ncbi:uncharacterized protein LOC108042172 isoform X1 [Drosophila rhopaloa]|uniref:CH-like domain-containing protein n=1 Tax=Drosophila rhopaloa TaxID=1041015 RepID=A0ABM5H7I1_DRORH|nr:uncharacterized protein LOC108042172 isoform X1 [Drosophila rhopaloa]
MSQSQAQSPNHMLNMEGHEDLKQWLKEQRIILDLGTRRYFSDVLPVAKIVKKCHPRLVDLHNYPTKCSVVLKLKSWDTFNAKVLKKLGINMPRALMEQLAAAVPGAIETLFQELIAVTKCGSPRPSPMLQASPTRSQRSEVVKQSVNKDTRSRTLNRSLTQVNERSSSNDKIPKVLTMDVDTLVNGKIKKVTKKVVDYEYYTRAVRESAEKSNYISSITQKADYLESMIAVKEERISELMDQLGKLSVSILSMRPMLSDNDDDNRISTNTHTHINDDSEPYIEFTT